MSNSIEHDALIKPAERWLRENCGCTHVVIEMARPKGYHGKYFVRGEEIDMWPSVDLYGFKHHFRDAISIDVKRTTPDGAAQCDKPYVIYPQLNIARKRYIARPKGMRCAIPDGYGDLDIINGYCSEGDIQAEAAGDWHRNWRAESWYIHRAMLARVIDEQGRATDRGIHAKRGKVNDIKSILVGPMLAKDIARELGMRKVEVDRVLRDAPGIKVSTIGGQRWYALAEKKARVSA